MPETIGSLSWLDIQGRDAQKRIVAGVVLTCLGYETPFLWKKSRSNNSLVDRIAQHCIGRNGACINFDPVTGSDERQYCSPGFNMGVGMLCRSYPGSFPEYHTSADTPDKIDSSTLESSLNLVFKICRSLECNDYRYTRVNPNGEPMLSRRKLYESIGIKKVGDFDRSKEFRTYLIWLLNYCDSMHELIDIAEMSDLDLPTLAEAAKITENAGLLKRSPISPLPLRKSTQ